MQSLLAFTSESEQAGAIDNPLLTPHLDYRVVEDESVLLMSETFNTLIHGKIYTDLMPLIDGSCSETPIQQTLDAQYSDMQIRSALANLAAKGYVVSGDFKMEKGQAAFWTSLGASPVFVERQLHNQAVAIHNDDTGTLASCLHSLGIASSSDRKPALSIVICSDYLDNDLVSINGSNIASGMPWMLIRPNGTYPMYGPVFQSAEGGPCLTCLTHRIRNNQEIHTYIRNHLGEDAAFVARAGIPVLLSSLYGVISLEIAKWLVDRRMTMLKDHLCTFDLNQAKTEFHYVQRRVQCNDCGDPRLSDAQRKPAALVLSSSRKNRHATTGVRSVAASETISRYRHLVSPWSGVVCWVKNMTPADDPWFHVHWSGANLALRIKSLSSLRRSLRQKSAGKGTSAEQSEVGALCEAIERYSSAFHGDEIQVRRRFSDSVFTQDQSAIHPNDVQLFSDLQIRNASEINARGHPYNIVPPCFDIDQPVAWSPVWSFSQNRHRYLPTAMLYGMTPEQRGTVKLWADSNGCAAGNTLEEAILQGFFELVERDAFAVWWYNRTQCPGVDLNSFGSDYLSYAPHYYEKHNRDMWVLDITSDLGIPCFVALSRRMDREPEDIIYGAGAHMDPAIAILRAVCELNQCLALVPNPVQGSEHYRIDDPMCLSWLKNIKAGEHPYLNPSETHPIRVHGDFSILGSEDMKEDIEWIQALIEGKGMELLVLDQTRPDIGMPVVRVIVPGLRHYWERFAPGRLYDVPVDMGLLHEKTPEEELNPLPVIA